MKITRYFSCFAIPMGAFALFLYGRGTIEGLFALLSAIMTGLWSMVIAAGAMIIPGSAADNGLATALFFLALLAALFCMDTKAGKDLVKIIDPDMPEGLDERTLKKRYALHRVRCHASYSIARFRRWMEFAGIVFAACYALTINAYLNVAPAVSETFPVILAHLCLGIIGVFCGMLIICLPWIMAEATRGYRLLISEYPGRKP